MPDILEAAQLAAQEQNWSSLIQCLQEALAQENNLDLAELLPLAVTAFKSGDFQTRWELAKLLPGFGQPAIAPLLQILRDEEEEIEIRWFAIRILASFNQPEVVLALVELLEQTSEEELEQALTTALAELGKTAIFPLSDLLSQPATRLTAIRALAQIPHPDTIPALIQATTDEEAEVRHLAISALGNFNDPEIPPALVAALQDRVAMVRRAAIEVLGTRSNLSLPNLVELLVERLWDFNLEVCQQAAISLGRLGTDQAAEPLFRVLTSAATPVPLQLEAARSLAWMGTAPALECLCRALTSLSVATPVYQEIISLLGRWSDPALKAQAAQVLLEALTASSATSADAKIRQGIALSLGYLQQPQALEPLMQLLADEDMSVRLHTIAALKTLNSEAAHARLEHLASQNDVPDQLKQGVAIALQEW